MNKCPKCHKQYEDPALFFCLEDGEKLVPHETRFPNSTPTVIVNPNFTPVSQPKAVKSNISFYLRLVAVGFCVFIAIIAGLIIIALQMSPPTDINYSIPNKTTKTEVGNSSEINEKPKAVTKSNQCELPSSVYQDFSEITFNTASTKLMAESADNLEGTAETLKQLPDDCAIEITVQTDRVRSSSSEKNLAQAQFNQSRANEIKNWLVKYGVKVDKIAISGSVNYESTADNSGVEGETKDYRIKLKIQSSETSQNNSDSADSVDLTNPETLAELKTWGAEIIDRNSLEISKPNPLALIVAIEVDGSGDLSLNSKRIGNILRDNNLVNKLNQIFKEREEKNILNEGTKEVEKTVIIRTLARTNREIFERTFKAIKESGASPIKVTGFLD